MPLSPILKPLPQPLHLSDSDRTGTQAITTTLNNITSSDLHRTQAQLGRFISPEAMNEILRKSIQEQQHAATDSSSWLL